MGRAWRCRQKGKSEMKTVALYAGRQVQGDRVAFQTTRQVQNATKDRLVEIWHTDVVSMHDADVCLSPYQQAILTHNNNNNYKAS